MSGATIADIAEATGLARVTVAQILSKRPGYSPKTRERVLAVAEQLNYRPNYLSKALAGGRSMAIGLLPASLTTPIGVMRLQAVEAAARAAGWVTYMIGWDESDAHDDETVARGMHEMLDRRVDGLIVYRTTPLGPNAQEALNQAKTPIVYIDRVPECVSDAHYIVRIDHGSTMRELAAHLAAQGHHQAAYLQNAFDLTHPYRRAEPYRRSFAAHGIEVALDERWVLPAGRTHEHGSYELLRQRLDEMDDRADRPTVLLAHNDASAMGALAALHDAGWSVPADMSVVGFDGLDMASVCRPSLTTIRQPRAEVGRAAFELLHQLMTEPDHEPEPVVFPCELRIGQSTGPAAGR